MSEFWFYPVHLELCWVPGLCRAACSVRSVSVSIGNFSTHTFLFPTRSQPEPELWALVSGSWIAETSSRAVQKNAQVSPTCRVMVKESQHSHPNWDPGDRKWLWPEAKEAMGAAHFCPKCWLSFSHSRVLGGPAAGVSLPSKGDCDCLQQHWFKRSSDPGYCNLLNCMSPFTGPSPMHVMKQSLMFCTSCHNCSSYPGNTLAETACVFNFDLWKLSLESAKSNFLIYEEAGDMWGHYDE